MAGVFTIRQTAGKAIAVDQFPPEAWTMLTGRNTTGDAGEVEKLWKAVPWLNRSIVLLANSMAGLPFVIVNERDEEIDSSADYQNTIGLWPDPFRDLWLMEAALSLFGASYWLKEQRGRGRVTVPAGIRYLVPHTVRPEIDVMGGVTGYRRTLEGQPTVELTPDELIAIWQPDPYGEIGPPSWSRAMAAMTAAGVLYNVDEFAKTFFERGAIKTTLLKVAGNILPSEKERVKSIWSRMMRGIKSAYRSLVVNADTMEPVVIGEGIGDLGNTSLTDEKRKEISAAMGVPESALWSSAANFAVKEGDQRDLYMQAVIPDSRLVGAALNTQWLNPLGYRIKFLPYQLDIFQEDEEDRSGALINLVNATTLAAPQVVRVMFEMLGMELPGGMEYDEFERILADARDDGREMAAEIGGQRQGMGNVRPAAGTMPDDEAMDEETKSMYIDLERWERKALKRLKSTGRAGCSFDSPHIPADLTSLIADMLDEATTVDEVRAIFSYERPNLRAGSVRAVRMVGGGVDAGAMHIHMPEIKMEAPVVHIPDIQMPEIIVNVPQQAAPVVNVSIPDQAAPVVTVNVPEQSAPVVRIENKVEFPARSTERTKIQRDAQGRATGSETETVYEKGK